MLKPSSKPILLKNVVIPETGEIVETAFIPKEGYKMVPIRQAEMYRKKVEVRQELKYFNELIGGSFTLHIEEGVRHLFNTNNFSDAEKVHIMYLGSFVNYEGRLMTRNNLPMTKELIRKKVKIKNKSRFNEFYTKLLFSEYIKELEGGVLWNSKLCFKGSPISKGTSSKNTIKTFDLTIQKLYEENEAKSLCIIFRMLPYVNKFHNVFCLNRDEIDFTRCKPLGLKQAAELLGEGDYRNLKQKLLRLRIGDEFIFSIRLTGSCTTIMVNPSLVWQSPKAPTPALMGDFSLAKAKLLESKQK
ncbi:hypothetical protein [Peribacillus sp. SCS-37]|uniref:hypothetical protein n=1 Tax=Paraperibacillus esterisolvens TaxID=3115296 RepID=UPI0039067FE8